MILSDISVRRPVLAGVLSLILVILGLLAVSRLAVREFPEHRSAGGNRDDGLPGRIG